MLHKIRADFAALPTDKDKDAITAPTGGATAAAGVVSNDYLSPRPAPSGDVGEATGPEYVYQEDGPAPASPAAARYEYENPAEDVGARTVIVSPTAKTVRGRSSVADVTADYLQPSPTVRHRQPGLSDEVSHEYDVPGNTT